VKAGSSTLRRLASLDRPNDRPTVRALPVPADVSESQLVDLAPRPGPARRPHSPTLNDLVAQSFFEEGHRQEAEGVFNESANVRLSSLDRVPRRRWPMVLAFLLVMGGAASGAWWLGFRPPAAWQQSTIWKKVVLSAGDRSRV
jgi:hypothetical protein